MNIKKIIGFIIAASISVNTSFSVFANSIKIFASEESSEEASYLYENNDRYRDGIWKSAEETNIRIVDSDAETRSILSSSVDNSTSDFFPDIEDQGNINSCAGWATTYYQYTYEVNRYRNNSINGDSDIYSPAWTYNYINGGANRYTYLADAYRVLENQGAMTLADYSHPASINEYSFEWPTNTQKMVDALEYRASPECICCYSSNSMNAVKSRLSSGKVAVIWTNPLGWTKTKTTNNEWIIISGSSEGNGGHFMTVVGYDDNITVQYNNVTMNGAFKVADSSGTDDYNGGYIWVAYDALNATSDYLGSQSNRKQIFGKDNEFYFIYIEHYDVYYVGKISYTSNDQWHNKIYGNISNNIIKEKFLPMETYYNNGGIIYDLSITKNRQIVFDYFNSSLEDVSDYINSSFTSKISNDTTNNTNRISFTLMDNLCQTIKSSGTYSLPSTGGQYSKTFNIHLKKGRISNYDNGDLTSSDLVLLSTYLMRDTNLSSLQRYLADMNDDGEVDIVDLALLNGIIASHSGSNYSVLDYLPEHFVNEYSSYFS